MVVEGEASVSGPGKGTRPVELICALTTQEFQLRTIHGQ